MPSRPIVKRNGECACADCIRCQRAVESDHDARAIRDRLIVSVQAVVAGGRRIFINLRVFVIEFDDVRRVVTQNVVLQTIGVAVVRFVLSPSVDEARVGTVRVGETDVAGHVQHERLEVDLEFPVTRVGVAAGVLQVQADRIVERSSDRTVVVLFCFDVASCVFTGIVAQGVEVACRSNTYRHIRIAGITGVFTDVRNLAHAIYAGTFDLVSVWSANFIQRKVAVLAVVAVNVVIDH